MNCYTSGIIGIGMLGATFATMVVQKDQKEKLKSVLSPELANIYENITKERRNLYFQGLLLGLLISYLCLRILPQSINTFHRVSFVAAITVSISVIYYFLMPKSDYMLNHLKTHEENVAWLTIYQTMQKRYLVGFLIGSLSAIPIAYAMC